MSINSKNENNKTQKKLEEITNKNISLRSKMTALTEKISLAEKENENNGGMIVMSLLEDHKRRKEKLRQELEELYEK